MIALLDSACAGASEHRKSDLSQRESLEWVGHARESSGGAVDEHSVLVNEINNHTHFAIIFSVVNERNSAGLYQSPQRLDMDLYTAEHLPSSLLYIK